MSQNRKKNWIRTERTSVIIPRLKDWGQVFFFFKSADCEVKASNSEWKEDDQLEQDLKTYISQNLKRSEILDFM